MEDYELSLKVFKEMKLLSDEDWRAKSRREKAYYVSAVMQVSYIESRSVFDRNASFFGEAGRGRIIGDVGGNPDPANIFIQLVAAFQSALVVKDNTVARNDNSIDREVAERVLDFFMEDKSSFFSRKIEEGVVFEMIALPDRVTADRPFLFTDEDGGVLLFVDVLFKWKEASGRKASWPRGDRIEVWLLECVDYAGRQLILPIVKKGDFAYLFEG